MILAYLLLLTGLTISAVAIYYSVVGLTAIFAAAALPIMIMGVSLEVAKLVAASWLKQNWSRAPLLIKTYMSIAIVVLMLITSMGIFGFLSKAHLDQSLVSGDVQSKIAVYDEKIKTAKDNIDANRKALKQMDEAVDQVMGRSTSETGADKAVAIRRSQQKERGRLQSEIASEQKAIASINEERAPIAAEVRKVEAEVGPLKYIAAFIYGANPDANILEKAVTWVIMLIVVVFDPLAVIMLLAAQMTFAWKKEDTLTEGDSPRGTTEVIDSEPPTVTEQDEITDEQIALTRAIASGTEPRDIGGAAYEADDGPLTDDQINQINELVKDDLPGGERIARTTLFSDITESVALQATPVLDSDIVVAPKATTLFSDIQPVEEVAPVVIVVDPCPKCGTELITIPGTGIFCPNVNCDVVGKFDDAIEVENLEPIDSGRRELVEKEAQKYQLVEEEESKKKSYMTKDLLGKIQVKDRS